MPTLSRPLDRLNISVAANCAVHQANNLDMYGFRKHSLRFVTKNQQGRDRQTGESLPGSQAFLIPIVAASAKLQRPAIHCGTSRWSRSNPSCCRTYRKGLVLVSSLQVVGMYILPRVLMGPEIIRNRGLTIYVTMNGEPSTKLLLNRSLRDAWPGHYVVEKSRSGSCSSTNSRPALFMELTSPDKLTECTISHRNIAGIRSQDCK